MRRALAVLAPLWIAALAAALLFVSAPAGAGICPNTYDKQIRSAAELYLPGIPWRLLKAQLCAESRLNPNARSAVGAMGVAQFMPATWEEVRRALGYGAVAPTEAGPAIVAAAYYMAQQRRRWRFGDLEKHKHGVASYNAGGGNILRAWRLCGEAKTWAVTVDCLDEITGRHRAETEGYVKRIFTDYWLRMEAGG